VLAYLEGALVIKFCRSCGSPALTQILDLGEVHVNAFPLPSEPDTPTLPIALLFCEGCSLVQVAEDYAQDQFFRGEAYHYRSSVTRSMREALQDIADSVRERQPLRKGDQVVSIGCNDGTELEAYFPELGLELVGFEPSALALEAREKLPDATIVQDYFALQGYREVSSRKAKVVQAIAMFYDLQDPNAFLHDVREVLAEDGVFVVQFTGLKHTLHNNDIGNVLTHEHTCLYTLTSIAPLFERAGLHIFDYQENGVNGGSMRVWASPTKRTPNWRFLRGQSEERAAGYWKADPYLDFAARAQTIRRQVRDFVLNEERPYALGASTKGNGLLQWWSLGRDRLLGCSERDPRKIGREMVGSRVPIVDEPTARAGASAFILLPFGFRAEVIEREKEFLAGGGKLLIPFPTPEVVKA
jgi:NDP-4-keto-2,6-dideoxyhexose 3-C-methyltransferase